MLDAITAARQQQTHRRDDMLHSLFFPAGFVAPEEPRRGARGAAEVPYRSTGKSWTLDVGEPDPDVTSAMVDAFRAELLESPVETRKASRLALRLTAELFVALHERSVSSRR